MNRIIDIHTHTFPEKIASRAIDSLKAKSHTEAFTDGTINMLASSMEEASISCSVVQPVATNPKQVVHVNDASMKINERFSETGIMSFGCMHPDFEDWHDELARVRDAGMKGIKIHPVYQGVSVDDDRYVRILRRCGELGLIVMFHAGFDIGFPGNPYALPERISRALDMAGSVRVILAHMGGWKSWREGVELLAGRKDVWIDTAFSLGEFTALDDGYYSGREECMMLAPDEFMRIVRAFGTDRVLFGSDSPWASQAETVKSVDALPLSEEEKRAIFWENTAELLGLNPQ